MDWKKLIAEHKALIAFGAAPPIRMTVDEVYLRMKRAERPERAADAIITSHMERWLSEWLDENGARMSDMVYDQDQKKQGSEEPRDG